MVLWRKQHIGKVLNAAAVSHFININLFSLFSDTELYFCFIIQPEGPEYYCSESSASTMVLTYHSCRLWKSCDPTHGRKVEEGDGGEEKESTQSIWQKREP